MTGLCWRPSRLRQQDVAALRSKQLRQPRRTQHRHRHRAPADHLHRVRHQHRRCRRPRGRTPPKRQFHGRACRRTTSRCTRSPRRSSASHGGRGVLYLPAGCALCASRTSTSITTLTPASWSSMRRSLRRLDRSSDASMRIGSRFAGWFQCRCTAVTTMHPWPLTTRRRSIVALPCRQGHNIGRCTPMARPSM
ncbi:MAG: hypothetical protein QOG53_1552 [Frankiales bacterium]|nr:hypothetical protein [Frankiales bacterium]